MKKTKQNNKTREQKSYGIMNAVYPYLIFTHVEWAKNK